MADRTVELSWLISRFDVKLSQKMRGVEVTLYTGKGAACFPGDDLDAAIMNAFNNASSLPLPK